MPIAVVVVAVVVDAGDGDGLVWFGLFGGSCGGGSRIDGSQLLS